MMRLNSNGNSTEWNFDVNRYIERNQLMLVPNIPNSSSLFLPIKCHEPEKICRIFEKKRKHLNETTPSFSVYQRTPSLEF